MMRTLHAALYARVSSEQQAEAQTIASQVAALRERITADQVVLVEELRRCGVEVVFLSRALGRSPEDDILLQVQGMMAEYERAKILERHRRGKLHAARSGSVNILSSTLSICGIFDDTTKGRIC